MKALVAYGTRYGSTSDVAKEIARVLEEADVRTDVWNLKKDPRNDLEQYDLVVIGSGIAFGSWSKAAQSFLERNAETLSKMRVAMFASCGDILFEPGKVEEHRKRYVSDVASKYQIMPMSEALFGGVLDFDKYSFLIKGILSAKNAGKKDMESRGIDISKPYDFRNWQEIRDWAGSLTGVN